MIVVDTPQPKSCWDCPLENGEEGYCQVTGTLVPLGLDGRLSDCPIKAVLPEHYGRLIDADAYIADHAESGWLDDITVEKFNKITPTIIPATERSNNADSD